MELFYGTFKFQSQHRDHWVRIECKNYKQAQELMELHYSGEWSMVYTQYTFQSIYFTKGELERIKLP